MNGSRRRLLAASALGLGAGALPGGAALASLTLTPRQTLGPFYPRELPLDADNDLVSVTGMEGLAEGHISHVFGRVLDPDGDPRTGCAVEIWQCNAFGRYHHPWDQRDAPLDPRFQGYGATVTDGEGRYRFRTIKPVAYPGRAPHVHFAVSTPQGARLVTQLYVKGEPANERDGLLRSIRDPAARALVVRPFAPDPQSPQELLASFDLVL